MYMLRKLKNIGHFINALIANIFYGFPSKRLNVIGVTGTDGKTTTSTLIYHILKTAGKKVALISTVAAYVGNQEIDTGFHVTTPNPWSLQKLIKQISSKNFDYLVLEVTSHGLDQHRLLGINFSVGVVTNITHEHLDYHINYQNYLRTKAKLFKYSQHAVINQQDDSFTKLKLLIPPSCKVHPYSTKMSAELFQAVKSRFPEPYNWSNAAAAITTAEILNIDHQQIAEAIKTLPQVKGRMEKIPNKLGITTLVDFAHTPNALRQALKALQTMRKPHAKIIAVFGSAGLRDKTKRPMMGKIGSDLADVIVLTAEDPRTEDVNVIISQIRRGATGKAQVYVEPDRQKAIDLAIVNLARPGDIVGVFGKGHEQSMCFGKIEHPWSDHEAIKQAIKKRQ